MLQSRVIPCLQLLDESLVKTIKFNKHQYIGDPINTVRIFNELEVDELVFLDIAASKQGREPNLKILKQIADECFMPLAYGGGIQSVDQAKEIFELGFEKIILNSAIFHKPALISEIATIFGSQAVVIAIDVKKDIWGRYSVYSKSGTINEKKKPVCWAKEIEQLGAGEVLLTSIDREGTWTGFDLALVKSVAEAIQLPVIAHGGAGTINDIENAIKIGKASAVAIGSMVFFQGKDLGVLISFPDREQLESILKIIQ